MPRDGARVGRGRRRRARWPAPAILLVALGVLPGCGGDGGEGDRASAASPNFVVVMTDDQDLASMEHMPIARREVADRGVEFTRSYVALSECCPSRATFLTGQHAHNHGVVANKPPDGGYPAL